MNKYERQGIREKKRPQNKRVKSRPAAAATIAKAKIRRAARSAAKAKSARHPRRYQSESVMPAPYRNRFPEKSPVMHFPENFPVMRFPGAP